MPAEDALNRELFHGTHKNLRINRNLAHATTDMKEAQEFAGKSVRGRADAGVSRARVFQVEPVDPDTLRESGSTVSTPYGFKVVKRVWTRVSR